MPETVTVIRSDQRRHVNAGWYDSRQSFGPPGNDRFGGLVVHNDSVIAPGAGFPMHHHEHMEIVTWIFTGAMEHRDSHGNHTRIAPGLAQRMSAGSGIDHSEINPDDAVASHGVQMWVLPDAATGPSYAHLDVTDRLATHELIPAISGTDPDAAVSIGRRDATLWAAKLRAHDSVELPEGGLAHLFVGTGAIDVESTGTLAQGDVVRTRDSGARRITAIEAAELLIWQFVPVT